MRYDELKGMLGSVDLDTYFKALGLPPGGEVIVQELAPIVSEMRCWSKLPPADTQAYLRWELLRRMSAYLTPAFIEINKTFTSRCTARSRFRRAVRWWLSKSPARSGIHSVNSSCEVFPRPRPARPPSN